MSDVKYDNHDREWVRCSEDPHRIAIANTWRRDDTVDAWRHQRMREVILPLVEANPNSRWLTVGDGRYGTDAHFLLRQGVDCHATDMTSPLLAMAHRDGFICDYSNQNAESLSFGEDAFDYVYCKESYHHFPRPWLAVHEMFRVARSAVILQEPADKSCLPASTIWRLLNVRLRALLGRSRKDSEGDHKFEPVGNYLYSLSLRECEKFLLGMHYRWIAWYGLNDHYETGVEFCPLEGGSPQERALREKTQSVIARKDARCRKGLASYEILTVILFKTNPVTETQGRLHDTGWTVKQLPANPYR